MTDHATAVASLAPRLSTEVYELVPEGDYFLGPEMIESIASALVAVFTAGLAAGVKGGVKKWGESAGQLLVDRIRQALVPLVDAIQPTPAPQPAAPPPPEVVTLVQNTYVVVLTDAGMNSADATRVARNVRDAVLQ